MNTYIGSLRVHDFRRVVCTVEVRNRYWEQGKLLLPVDGGKTWNGELQEVVRCKVLMPLDVLNNYRRDEAVKAAANFLSRARNRAKLLLGQDVLSVKALDGIDDFNVVAVPLGSFGNFSALLPQEWAELRAWNELPDPEDAARQIVAAINEGTYDEASAAALLKRSVQKVDSYEELHGRLRHVRRDQPGFNSRNYATKKPYRSKPTDEDYRDPNGPDWDDDK